MIKLKSIIKIISVCTLTIFLGFTPLFVYANNQEEINQISEETFNSLKSQGVYDDEISYEDFLKSINLYEDYSIPTPRSNSSYTPKKGDIVTTGYYTTASSGVIGHAGIFIDNTNILHIAGSNTSKITTLTWSQWKSTYRNKNIVFRVPNSTIANQAANWVIRNYKGKSPGYRITSNWRSTSPTYCSKIVWQGYYFGTGSAPVMKKPVEPFIIHPRTIATYFNKNYAPRAVFSN